MKNRTRIFLSLTVLYAIIIFYLSSRSSQCDLGCVSDFFNIKSLKNIIEFIEHSDLRFLMYPLYVFSKYPDKIIHTILYAGFGLLLYLTLNNYSNTRNYAFILAIIIGTAYGASDEIHQSFVPGRTASFYDLLADIIGITLSQTIILIKDKLYFKSKKLKMN